MQTELIAHGNSDTGLTREKNEDRFLIRADLGIYAVADGLGGLPQGEKAAEMTLQLLEEFSQDVKTSSPEAYEKLLNSINSEVWKVGMQIAKETSIGTTLSAVIVQNETPFLIHVGDSAIYRLRDGVFTQLTVEHTMAQELMAAAHGANLGIPEFMYHTLTACVGQKEDISGQIEPINLKSGDRLLLCTDGLCKYVDRHILEETLHADISSEDIVTHFIDQANLTGGVDNVTVIVIDVK